MKHIARKRFGQNFLTDQAVLSEIINCISPRESDLMVEIGPGLGAMTRLLLQSLAQLQVVELDRDLVERLRRQYDPARLVVHSGDALEFDFGALREGRENDKLRIVGNLPYNISSPLLFHLTGFAPVVRDQHFMLQKEVVERMVAEPGSKAYGRLSVMLQWRYAMDMLMTVPPSAFDPPPKVDSAIVRMIPLASPLDCDEGLLEKVVTQAFSQRRKVLRNCLSPLFSEQQIQELGVDPQARPETVPVGSFVALANLLRQQLAGQEPVR